MNRKVVEEAMLKAIETLYNGITFRSRLEARWAVFLDNLGVTYNYELKRFDLFGITYIPDFYMEQYHCWIEIKPHTPNAIEINKAIRLCRWTKQEVIIYVGDIWRQEVKGYAFYPIPCNSRVINKFIKKIQQSNNPAYQEPYMDLFFDIDKLPTALDKKGGYMWTTVLCTSCPECRQVSLGIEDIAHKKNCKSKKPGVELSKNPHLMAAYTAARQVHFRASK